MPRITGAAFAALLELTRCKPDAPSAHAAWCILGLGWAQADAAHAAGITTQAAGQAAARIRKAHALARIAAGR